MALFFQLPPERLKVLNYAVVHKINIFFAVMVGMGIDFIRNAVSGQAGMQNKGTARNCRFLKFFLQIFYSSRGFEFKNFSARAVKNRQTGGIRSEEHTSELQ